MKKSKYVGKIGWCDKYTLNLRKGHFVYIRKYSSGKCSVNTFSSIENNNGEFEFGKLCYLKNGTLYAVSKKDLNLPRFSGLDIRIIKNVPLEKIHDIDKYKIKGRHKHYINKYVK